MTERRKSPRYPVSLPVYFPHFETWGRTDNVSMDGCYVVVDLPAADGFVTDILIELPVIGTIAMKGYVQHHHGPENGMGLQFIQVRFAKNQSYYYNLYARFIKILPKFEEIRSIYLEMVQTGELKLLTLPKRTQNTG